MNVPTTMDDSRSATLHEEKRSSPPSRDEEKPGLNEKEAEANVRTAAPTSVQEPIVVEPTEAYKEIVSEHEEPGLDLKQIKTSESGVEYPHGLKLGLISLALCLAVFLMALDVSPNSNSICLALY